MTESVWYSAVHNEIWVKISRNRIERGCQAEIPVEGNNFSVPDNLCLFSWRLDLNKFKIGIAHGLIIKLGEL